MQKVISVNLNGHAYHLEEGGYDLLRAYLDSAAERLQGNPDRDEIIADLEQAIAEKCGPYLGSQKSVVTAREMQQILDDMGPVRDPEMATDAKAEGDPKAAASDNSGEPHDTPKRLYQIREGAMISGVCNGLAAFLNVDVTIVRIVFVALAVLTKGFWALVYVAMAIMIPFASTAEERAAAHGMPFNAQELIDRTKKNYLRQRRHWARQWRRATRGPSTVADGGQRPAYAVQVLVGVLTPVFALLQAAALVLFVLAIISLVNNNTVFGWSLPEPIPLWAGVLMLVFVYQAIVMPLQAARYTAIYGPAVTTHRPQEAWAGIVSLAATAFGFWLAYQYIPEVRGFVHDVPRIAREVWEGVARQ
jgi:phage shock protein PspC (stress-responsive transcriptional regulator)